MTLLFNLTAMNNNEPVSVPLVERLRSVPLFAREVIECDLGSRNVPYGTMCHEAANEIELTRKLRDGWQARAKRAERDLATANTKLAYWRGVITDAAKREDAVESTSTLPPAVRPRLGEIPPVGRILVRGYTDRSMWYADKVGKEFPYFARDSYGFWVRTGDKFNTSNYVRYEDAEIVQEAKP